MCRSLTLRAACGAGLLAAASLSAAANLSIVNAGFEDIAGETPNGEFTFGPLNGWDLYDPDGVTAGGAGGTFFIGTLTPFETDPVGSPGVFTNFPAGAFEGNRVGIAFNFDNSEGSEYGFQQTLIDVAAAHTTYTLQVAIGNIASGQSTSGTFFELSGFPGYRIDLLAGGVVIASDSSSAGTIADGEFGIATLQFTTGAADTFLGEALGIRLVNLNQEDALSPSSDLEVDFDAVQLTATAVPAPTSALLAFAVLIGLGAARHRT